jgi:two-component system, LytTR family, sensor kinase
MQTGRTVDLTEPETGGGTAWLIAAVSAGGAVLYAIALHLEKPRLDLSIALSHAAVFSVTLALVMLLVAAWDRRAVRRRRSAWIAALSEAAIAIVAIALWQVMLLIVNRIEIGPYYWRVYTGTWLFQLLFDATVYGSVRGLMLGAAFWRRDRERERREAALVLAARDLELSAIRTQFQPHFVLNALNSLLALIDHDPALARTMVVRLADLMTAVFDRGDLHELPLERELDLVRAYLDVERIRLGTRLSVRFDIEDAAREVLVPPFLLQPIVENAVKHGVAPYQRPGFVAVNARVRDGRLHVAVVDSGASDAAGASSSSGRGLSITRRRLETCYGDGYALSLDHGADGTTARIDVPVELARVA